MCDLGSFESRTAYHNAILTDLSNGLGHSRRSCAVHRPISTARPPRASLRHPPAAHLPDAERAARRPTRPRRSPRDGRSRPRHRPRPRLRSERRARRRNPMRGLEGPGGPPLVHPRRLPTPAVLAAARARVCGSLGRRHRGVSFSKQAQNTGKSTGRAAGEPSASPRSRHIHVNIRRPRAAPDLR